MFQLLFNQFLNLNLFFFLHFQSFLFYCFFDFQVDHLIIQFVWDDVFNFLLILIKRWCFDLLWLLEKLECLLECMGDLITYKFLSTIMNPCTSFFLSKHLQLLFFQCLVIKLFNFLRKIFFFIYWLIVEWRFLSKSKILYWRYCSNLLILFSLWSSSTFNFTSEILCISDNLLNFFIFWEFQIVIII